MSVIAIRGSRKREKEVGDEDYLYQECYWGRFARSIILPQEVDPDGEYDWWDMAFGFFMGLGFEPDDAADLANNAKL